MAKVPAGYDKLSAIGNLGSDTVITAGLMNCIGIVCINATYKRVAIAHFDTSNAAEPLLERDIQGATNYFAGVKHWLESKTHAEKFVIGVGCIWFDMAGTKSDTMRHALLVSLKNAFNDEPTVWGKCLRYADGKLEGSLEESWVDDLDWAKAGTDIPYRELRV